MAASAEIPKADGTGVPVPKSFTVTLPANLAAKAEALAEREGRGVGELIGDAFRAYYGDFVFCSLDEVREYAATCNPNGYTEEDIPRLIREVRAEQDAEESALKSAKAS